jgi:homoserine dehydrogenase
LIAKAELNAGKLSLSVLLTLSASSNDSDQVENEYNALTINSENGETQFYKGKGAGSVPIGSFV